MKIKELFTDSSKWTKGSLARDKNGDLTSYYSSDAVCFCLHGAIYKCYEDFGDKSSIITNKIRKEIKRYSISGWNDAEERTFEEVKNLVEKLDI